MKGNFSQLVLEMDLTRESGHYILDFYVPAVFLVCTSWLSFWVDAHNVTGTPARVGLGNHFINFPFGLE